MLGPTLEIEFGECFLGPAVDVDLASGFCAEVRMQGQRPMPDPRSTHRTQFPGSDPKVRLKAQGPNRDPNSPHIPHARGRSVVQVARSTRDEHCLQCISIVSIWDKSGSGGRWIRGREEGSEVRRGALSI